MENLHRTTNYTLANIMKLSVNERILIVEDLWDTIADESKSVSLSEAQKRELDKRLESYRKNPETGSSWKEVKTRIKS
ncbi:MAG: addiction module protein [Armatimonadetes bacterium]|nr:addiction module protein [Armatimonadota bacterium]